MKSLIEVEKPICIHGHDPKYMILENNIWWCKFPTDDFFEICGYHPHKYTGNRKGSHWTKYPNCIECGTPINNGTRCPECKKILHRNRMREAQAELRKQRKAV
jgi:hypothetical protein